MSGTLPYLKIVALLLNVVPFSTTLLPLNENAPLKVVPGPRNNLLLADGKENECAVDPCCVKYFKVILPVKPLFNESDPPELTVVVPPALPVINPDPLLSMVVTPLKVTAPKDATRNLSLAVEVFVFFKVTLELNLALFILRVPFRF